MKTNRYRVLSLAATLVVVACMTGCDGQEQATETLSAAPVSDGPDPNEREAAPSEMTLTHVRSGDSLQAQGGPVQFKASGAVLSTDLSMYTVYVNKSIVDKSVLSVQGDLLSVNSALKDGRNKLSVYVPDAEGALVALRTSIWAGAESVQGKVVDEAGRPVSGATVVAALTDDSKVTAMTTTDSAGHYILKNFPKRTVMVTGTDRDNLSGSTTSLAGTSFPDLVLWSFGTPVITPNNDFSRGIDGWINRSGPPPTLEDHIENPGPTK